jgi:hypothetical protein
MKNRLDKEIKIQAADILVLSKNGFVSSFSTCGG